MSRKYYVKKQVVNSIVDELNSLSQGVSIRKGGVVDGILPEDYIKNNKYIFVIESTNRYYAEVIKNAKKSSCLLFLGAVNVYIEKVKQLIKHFSTFLQIIFMKIKNRVTREEIEKLLVKLKKELKNIKAKNKKAKEFLKNVDAYIYDCKHFLKRGDYVLSFESIVWAWAWYEISKELKLIR